MTETAPAGRWRKVALAFLVSGLLIAAVLSQVDPESAAERLAAADGRFILFGLGSSFLVLMSRSLRFWALTHRTSVLDMVTCVAAQAAINRIAPLRLGELSLPYLLHRTSGEPPAPVVINLLLVRLVELWVVLVTATVGAALWFSAADATRSWTLGVAIAVLTASLLAFRWLMRLGVTIAHALVARTPLRKVAAVPRIMEKLDAAVADDARLTTRQRVALIGGSMAVMGINYVTFGLLMASLGYDLDPRQLVVGVTASQLAGALPVVSVGSVGTHETGWVAGFVWVGVAVPDAVLTGVFTQVVTLGFAVLFALPAAWRLVAMKRRDPTG